MIRAGTSLRGLRMISSPPRRRRTSNADTVLNQADWFTAEKDKYLTIAEDHAKLGYGRSNFPIVAGMTSIDNYYLLLSLWHGFIASGLLIFLLFGTTIRLFRRGLRETDLGFPRPSLAFTLAGILVAVIFTLATVYMGTQVIPIVAMLLGWSDAYLLGPMCSEVSESAASVGLNGQSAVHKSCDLGTKYCRGRTKLPSRLRGVLACGDRPKVVRFYVVTRLEVSRIWISFAKFLD